MLKSIKVEQGVYDALKRLTVGHETYGETIMRLITAYEKAGRRRKPKPPVHDK